MAVTIPPAQRSLVNVSFEISECDRGHHGTTIKLVLLLWSCTKVFTFKLSEYFDGFSC